LTAEKAVAAIGHTRANTANTRAAVEAGARFATHLWNAMAPLSARATGPIAELLLEPRVILGLIADGRHVHPRVEELTVRLAGPDRIALTSDLVALPGHDPEGRLLGGDRAGAALLARMARFGLREAAAMTSLVPARLLGLTDRGRVAPGFRADLAVLDDRLSPLETIVAGETAWDVRYPQSQKLDDKPPSTDAPGSGA
jgi:N-acetylglucosamine-6-phosphate deacetylase